jgi:hypothetical protein
MPQMTDPSDALASFQQGISAGVLALQRGDLDQKVLVHADTPNGSPRFTYVRVNQNRVTALAMFVAIEPLDGIPRFALGYAVPDAYRGQGWAKGIVRAGLAELKAGLARVPIRKFYVYAVVGEDNLASQKVAEATVSKSPETGIDAVSGLPAFHYFLLVE